MQIFEVWRFHQSSNLTFVVSKWRHDVTWKSGCFSAPERGDFSKNSDVLLLLERVSFVLAHWAQRLVRLVPEISTRDKGDNFYPAV